MRYPARTRTLARKAPPSSTFGGRALSCLPGLGIRRGGGERCPEAAFTRGTG